MSQKRGKVFTWPLFAMAALKTKEILLWNGPKCARTAKDRLGIPIPSIFVAQREDGAWEVVDGLQRLATVFELMGIL